MEELIVIIMAGGLGKRMKSDIPKVLHNINNKPMLVRVIENSFLLKPKKIMVVVGKYKDIIENTIQKYIPLDKIEFIIQPNANGTGDAIKCCREKLSEHKDHKVLILSGDVPLVSSETMKNTINNLKECKIVITEVENPTGLGRIMLENEKFVKIIEEKDCDNEEKMINIVNTGIYSFNSDILFKYLPFINNNNSQKEYYLTDIIEIIKNNENIDIDMYKIEKEKQYELTGVNTQEQLIELNEIFNKIRG
jgi:UDP-N-acetylglucosamine diphosphorylase/glucosamine-1-phosphate N-acetyltransferase